MRKHFKVRSVVLLLAFIVLLSSCNNADNSAANTNTAAGTTTAATNTETTASAKAGLAATSGTLDDLWTDTVAFNKIPNGRKLVFSFAFRGEDTLTLVGWFCPNATCSGNFSTNPDITLTKGKPAGVKYGPNVIFGNVVMANNAIKKIKDIYANKYKYIVFKPSASGDYIMYKVYVTNDEKGFDLPGSGGEDTGVELNPSPPRN